MPLKILLVTPPFTQLNTPYPATPYLKGFLNQFGYDVFQADLSIELINRIFSRDGFQKLFDLVKKKGGQLSRMHSGSYGMNVIISKPLSR